jgi:ABC-type nitrate/sulfonate/bicarbonate transport system permease component
LTAAPIIEAVGVGIAFYHAVVLLERRVTGWRPSAPAI